MRFPPPAKAGGFQRIILMKTSLRRFIRFTRSERSEKGQDFPEYALILGTIAVVALAVLAPLRQAIITAFNFAIAALQAAIGG